MQFTGENFVYRQIVITHVLYMTAKSAIYVQLEALYSQEDGLVTSVLAAMLITREGTGCAWIR